MVRPKSQARITAFHESQLQTSPHALSCPRAPRTHLWKQAGRCCWRLLPWPSSPALSWGQSQTWGCSGPRSQAACDDPCGLFRSRCAVVRIEHVC